MGNSDEIEDEAFFERLAQAEPSALRAPARLKSRVYSALMREAAEAAPLRSLTATEAAGHRLCVFEKFVQILPLGARLDSVNYCRFCHGRVLGENMDSAPIFWKGCPYADFHRH
ncbi:MAG TPA: hypothetical protein VGL03_00595 [Thermoanaerobaculia bacterium]|jgi:hypothetical protein